MKKVYREHYTKAFKSGNSLAVMIQKELADKIGLKGGSPLKIDLKEDGKIMIEARA